MYYIKICMYLSIDAYAHKLVHEGKLTRDFLDFDNM